MGKKEGVLFFVALSGGERATAGHQQPVAKLPQSSRTMPLARLDACRVCRIFSTGCKLIESENQIKIKELQQ